MQDRSGQAFVMMTANDPSALPPEFLRKGRFDDIWFIDLPTKSERASISAATLRSNGRDAKKLGIDLHAVADATAGFTGAEVAAAIEHDAMFSAFADGAREVTTEDIVSAANKIIPLSRTSSEKIEQLRSNWSSRARLATRPDASTPQAQKNVRTLDF
jgi:SpoVK/Ycf46/Vps4 family AAA+-type ATPase